MNDRFPGSRIQTPNRNDPNAALVPRGDITLGRVRPARNPMSVNKSEPPFVCDADRDHIPARYVRLKEGRL